MLELLLNTVSPTMIDAIDENHQTALHLSVINVHPACVKLLLDKEANRELKDKKGQTPESLARSKNTARHSTAQQNVAKLFGEVTPRAPAARAPSGGKARDSKASNAGGRILKGVAKSKNAPRSKKSGSGGCLPP